MNNSKKVYYPLNKNELYSSNLNTLPFKRLLEFLAKNHVKVKIFKLTDVFE